MRLLKGVAPRPFWDHIRETLLAENRPGKACLLGSSWLLCDVVGGSLPFLRLVRLVLRPWKEAINKTGFVFREPPQSWGGSKHINNPSVLGDKAARGYQASEGANEPSEMTVEKLFR